MKLILLNVEKITNEQEITSEIQRLQALGYHVWGYCREQSSSKKTKWPIPSYPVADSFFETQIQASTQSLTCGRA